MTQLEQHLRASSPSKSVHEPGPKITSASMGGGGHSEERTGAPPAAEPRAKKIMAKDKEKDRTTSNPKSDQGQDPAPSEHPHQGQ